MKSPLAKLLIPSLLITAFILPAIVFAQPQGTTPRDDVEKYGGIIPCGFDYDGNGVVTDGEEVVKKDSSGKVISKAASPVEQCHFADVLILFKNLMNALIKLSTLLLVGAMIFVGFRLLASQGNPSALGDAKKMAINFLWGYFWIMIAWVLINTISNALLKDGYSLLKN